MDGWGDSVVGDWTKGEVAVIDNDNLEIFSPAKVVLIGCNVLLLSFDFECRLNKLKSDFEDFLGVGTYSKYTYNNIS